MINAVSQSSNKCAEYIFVFMYTTLKCLGIHVIQTNLKRDRETDRQTDRQTGRRTDALPLRWFDDSAENKRETQISSSVSRSSLLKIKTTKLTVTS